jgi:hypothetical protein
MEVQMQRTSRAWKRVAIVAFLILGSGIGHAQNPSGAQMTAERSWQLQSILQNIDADRETWVNLLISRWSAVLNPAVYDPASELGSVARVAPAWQVYGAYLATDFLTASDILHGRKNAGPYIAAQSASGETQAQSVAAPQVLGDSFTEQVYNVVSPPCRVVDTRLAGARTGPLVPGVQRTFDLGADAETDGQGGGPFAPSCGTLPSFHPIAWAINIAVVGVSAYTGHGFVKVWPFTGPEPNASVINWMPGQNGAISNGLTLTGCPGCADSIFVKSFGVDQTHLIIDVMGYYSPATFNSSTVTRVAGAPVSVPGTGVGTFVPGAACPAGTVLVGGDVDHGSTGAVVVSSSGQVSPTTWIFKMVNGTGSAVGVTAFSRCMDTPVKFN